MGCIGLVVFLLVLVFGVRVWGQGGPFPFSAPLKRLLCVSISSNSACALYCAVGVALARPPCSLPASPVDPFVSSATVGVHTVGVFLGQRGVARRQHRFSARGKSGCRRYAG